MNQCAKHASAGVAGKCGQCAHAFCEDCLVFPFGPAKPPMCLGCAMSFAGVRHRNALAPRKERRTTRFGRKAVTAGDRPLELELFDSADPFV